MYMNVWMGAGDKGVGDLIDDKSSKSVKRTETIFSYFYSKILYRVLLGLGVPQNLTSDNVNK